MRIWSIHPKYLDAKGLVALWRESLLAKHVLEGKTKGYRNHPQLTRFKNSKNPVAAINKYLTIVYKEAVSRNYNFNSSKIQFEFKPLRLYVTDGQMHYELKHLLNKLKTRDPDKYKAIKTIETCDPHPLFKVINGKVEPWEVKKKSY